MTQRRLRESLRQPDAGFIIAERQAPMQPTCLVDIGINLAHDSFDHDRDAVIARALEAGVCGMIVTGSSLESTEQAIGLCRERPDRLRATAGVHPHHARDFPRQDLARLEALMRDPTVASAGECGLDYFRNFSPPAEQRRAFADQLGLAIRVGKPVFLHQRDAHADFMAILGEHLPDISNAVVHCFTGTGPELEAYLAAGLSIGITGWVCDERRGLGVRELVREIPLERLMIETDGPYLMPRNIEPKPSSRRNESMYLPYILRSISEVRSEAPEEIAAATAANARRFFRLPSTWAGSVS